MFEFKLPDLGEGIHEAEILKWHVAAGDLIKEDDPLVDVETDKASVTIPSPRGGKVFKIAGSPGATITVGQILAVIDDGEGTQPTSPDSKPIASDLKGTTAANAVAAPERAHVPAAAAPATRRLARELNVNINLISGTGPGGRVTPEDVRRRVPSTEPVQSENTVAGQTALSPSSAYTSIPLLVIEPLPDFSLEGAINKEPLRSIRRKVARRMVTSSILVPHVAHMDEADVTELEQFRHKEKEKHANEPGGHLTLLAFVVKAVTAGLKAAPAFNASVDAIKEEIIFKQYYNIGIAVDTGRGLVVPVIRETGCKSIRQIAADIDDLSNKARADKLSVGELRSGTFTITNVGPLGGTAMIPIVNYPEVAILGMGRVQEKPVVRDGQIVIRKILPLTLAFDHRIADGADAARFVTELVRHLSDPNLLLLES